MNFEFMTIDTPLPPCMPFPRALTGFPVSSTAKVMYCRMLDAMLSKGQEDENGILFVCFPVTAIAAVLSRSPMTVKRSLNELETAGLIMRVRQGVGEPNRIYVLIPGKEDAALALKAGKTQLGAGEAKKKLRKAINDEKALQHQLKQLRRNGPPALYSWRYAGSFLQEPERLTDDDVMLLLKLIFRRPGHAGTTRKKTSGTGEAGNP